MVKFYCLKNSGFLDRKSTQESSDREAQAERALIAKTVQEFEQRRIGRAQ